MHKKTNIILLILVLFFSNNSYSKSVYDTNFHHVEVITENASATKSEIINIISIKSFLNIIDRILTNENKNQGIASICIGGGEASSILVRRLS